MASFTGTMIDVPFAAGVDTPVWPAVDTTVPFAAARTVNQLPSVAFQSSTLTAATIEDLVTVMVGVRPRIEYADGFADGEQAGFSDQVEHTMPSIYLGETDADARMVAFHIYTGLGLRASGIKGEGGVCNPGVGGVQVNRDLAGYVNSAGTFAHVGDGEYRYTFSLLEVSGAEGNIWLRVKVNGFRTVVLRVPLRTRPPTAAALRDAVLAAARTGHITTGTIGEGVAIATALLQGNVYMDQVTNGVNGQTSARLRCFHTSADAQAATAGGSGQGEFATFIVTTEYTGNNKISEHRVVQQ